MFEFITINFIIETVIAVAVVALIGVVAYFTASTIRNYIRDHLTKENANAQSVVMKNRLENGNYCVAVGFLDGNTQIYEGKAWEAQQLDGEMQIFPNDTVVKINS